MPFMKLPEPECELGYTNAQLVDIMGTRMVEFNKWMSGQTVSLCDGQRYNHETKKYEPTGCGPHGSVVYSWDVKNFFTEDSMRFWD